MSKKSISKQMAEAGLLKTAQDRHDTPVTAVNHPVHYNQHPAGIECIDVIEHMTFPIGNVIKYAWRADYKNDLEDLEKAKWYLDREIVRRSKLKADEPTTPEKPPLVFEAQPWGCCPNCGGAYKFESVSMGSNPDEMRIAAIECLACKFRVGYLDIKGPSVIEEWRNPTELM
jgi:hypothetical protein